MLALDNFSKLKHEEIVNYLIYLQELYNSLGFINLNKPMEADNFMGMSLLAKSEDLY